MESWRTCHGLTQATEAATSGMSMIRTAAESVAEQHAKITQEMDEIATGEVWCMMDSFLRRYGGCVLQQPMALAPQQVPNFLGSRMGSQRSRSCMYESVCSPSHGAVRRACGMFRVSLPRFMLFVSGS